MSFRPEMEMKEELVIKQGCVDMKNEQPRNNVNIMFDMQMYVKGMCFVTTTLVKCGKKGVKEYNMELLSSAFFCQYKQSDGQTEFLLIIGCNEKLYEELNQTESRIKKTKSNGNDTDTQIKEERKRKKDERKEGLTQREKKKRESKVVALFPDDRRKNKKKPQLTDVIEFQLKNLFLSKPNIKRNHSDRRADTKIVALTLRKRKKAISIFRRGKPFDEFKPAYLLTEDIYKRTTLFTHTFIPDKGKCTNLFTVCFRNITILKLEDAQCSCGMKCKIPTEMMESGEQRGISDDSQLTKTHEANAKICGGFLLDYTSYDKKENESTIYGIYVGGLLIYSWLVEVCHLRGNE